MTMHASDFPRLSKPAVSGRQPHTSDGGKRAKGSEGSLRAWRRALLNNACSAGKPSRQTPRLPKQQRGCRPHVPKLRRPPPSGVRLWITWGNRGIARKPAGEKKADSVRFFGYTYPHQNQAERSQHELFYHDPLQKSRV